MRTNTLSITTLAIAATVISTGCIAEQGSPWAEGEVELPKEQSIIQGTQPFAAHHDAVVALHNRFGTNVSPNSFCTGTLISPTVVLTAAHCIDGESANRLAIYLGDNPTTDGSPEYHAVTEALVHPQYNTGTMRNDLGLLRLATEVTSADPIPVLPPSLGYTNSDNGSLQLEFVGFGRTEFGGSDEKLVATATLAGTGCAVSGCGFGGTSAAERATKISYSQFSSGGPCNGDSGGPAFVVRSGTIYVGGMTSYGDANCTQYGVSARADAYYDLINAFVGPGGTGVGGGNGGGNTGGDGDGDGDTDPGTIELGNGDVELVAGAKDSARRFIVTLDDGAFDLDVSLSGGSGDADLYVRFEDEPTLSTYDCRPYLGGNNESCDFDAPPAREVHILVVGYSDYSNANLTVSWSVASTGDGDGDGDGDGGDGDTGGDAPFAAEANDLDGQQGTELRFVADVPAGSGELEVLLFGGEGDADLYVKRGSAPTLSDYDCRPYVVGNLEQCLFDDEDGGEYFIMVHGYSAFSGASVRVSRE